MKYIKQLSTALIITILMTGAANAAGGKQKPPQSETEEVKVVSIFDWFK